MRYPMDDIKRMHLLLDHFDNIKHCSCFTKTPCVEYHDPLCEYRVSMESINVPDEVVEVKITSGERKKVLITKNNYGIEIMTMKNGFQWSGMPVDEEMLDMLVECIEKYRSL
jgi:hypothetical protein